MAVIRPLLIGVIAASIVGVVAAESGFRLQRVPASDDGAYAGALDEKVAQPVRVVDLHLGNGTVAAMNDVQAGLLDVEPAAVFSSLSSERRSEIEKFVRATLVPLLRMMRRPGGARGVAIQVAQNAEQAFPGSDVGNALRELAEASLDPESNEGKIRGCVARLNTQFHPSGLHFTFGRYSEFDGGTVELMVYAVSQRLVAQIKNRTVPVYVLSPFDERFRVLALGMMEVAPPRIFIFKDMIDLQVKDIQTFLRAEKDYPFEDPSLPSDSVPLAVQRKINAIVRKNLVVAVGTNRNAIEHWLINSVARHEGQHLFIDRSIKNAAESRKIEWTEFNRFHERQAYLFELETSDPEFTQFTLLASFAISAALSDKYSRVGCGAALRGLQKELSSVRFWEGDYNRPIPAGLIPLFQTSGAEIRRAARQARREVERFLISSESDLQEETAADR